MIGVPVAGVDRIEFNAARWVYSLLILCSPKHVHFVTQKHVVLASVF